MRPTVGAVGVRAKVAALSVAAALLGVAGCSSGRDAAPSSVPPTTATATATTLPGGEGGMTTRSSTTVPATTTAIRTPVRTSSPGATAKPAKVREVTKACPYLSNDAEQIAEGKKVGRSTVLLTSPVGCRFYLAYPDYHAVAQISVTEYPSALRAFNTVARTGGSTAESTPGIGDGAVLYRTHFYRPDGNRDWACIFAKGKTVVTVHTDATMSSVDARNVARAIVGKF